MCVYNSCVTLIGSSLQKYCEETLIAVCQSIVATSYNGGPHSVICKLGIKKFAMMDDLFFLDIG